jgi:SPP1 gp7 family putative phage head morphogenesis protein
MPTIDPTELARIDQAIKTQLDILRHSATIEADILRVLEEMKQELIAKLAQGDLTNWSKARLNQMLRDTEAVIASYYTQAQSVLAPTYSAVAGVSAAQTATALAVTAPPRAVLGSLVSNMLVEGAPLKAWWAKQSADTHFKFSAAVRQGIAQSETLNQIFKRVGDATDLANRNSIALVHTSIMQIMNDANIEVIKQNADVAPTVRWVASLDSNTCPVCAPRDGLRWDTRSGRPIGHDIPYAQPPIHVNCRCRLTPVTRLTDFGVGTELEGQRASSSGPVPASTTFAQFLKRQTPEFQAEVLGKGRAELFRSGKITLRDLVSGRGAPLSLKQLEARYK